MPVGEGANRVIVVISLTNCPVLLLIRYLGAMNTLKGHQARGALISLAEALPRAMFYTSF